MHRVELFLVSALVSLLIACEAPSTPSGKALPYVEASFSVGFNDSKAGFFVQVRDRKRDGPAIRDAIVTWDGQTIPSDPYGLYWAVEIAPAIAGSEHTLRISHATAFDPIEVKILGPSGSPASLTIANAPSDWKIPLATGSGVSYTVSPTGGASSATNTVVWATSYDAFFNYIQSSPFYPLGSSVVCAFPTGTVYTGFSARNLTRVSIPGATADSSFRMEGAELVRSGFDPSTLPPYNANLELAYDGAEWHASSYFFDTGYVVKHAPQSVNIAGKLLKPESATYPNDFSVRWLASALENGSTISYSFTDPDGVAVSGSTERKSVDLQVPVSTPPKDSIGASTSLTFAAPQGGWPVGSRLFIEVHRPDNSAYFTSRYGYGTSPIIFSQDSSYAFGAPNTVTIKGAVETQVPLPGYRGMLRLVGPGVSW